MHMLFSDSEKKWIYLDKFGWPIKSGCPDSIRKSIAKKKQAIIEQRKGEP